jgi:hypothetical protein
MPAATVGPATSILGVLGTILQLSFSPSAQAKLGTPVSFPLFLLLFPSAYFPTLYLATLPSSTNSTELASGAFIWIGITVVLILRVAARTFTLPATIILLYSYSTHP